MERLDLKALELIQVMTMPFEVPNVKIVMDDSLPEEGILLVCTNQEALTRTHPERLVGVGEAVAIV